MPEFPHLDAKHFGEPLFGFVDRPFCVGSLQVLQVAGVGQVSPLHQIFFDHPECELDCFTFIKAFF